MKAYHDLMRHVLEHGIDKSDRTGTGTRSVFGYQMRFDLSKGFPLLTTKKLHLRSIIHELLWFLKGDTNIKYLKDNNVSIWDEWADENGDLGPVYGYQWRSWPAPDGRHIDQIANVTEQIKKNPDSRRLIVSAWNPALVDEMLENNVQIGRLLLLSRCTFRQSHGGFSLACNLDVCVSVSRRKRVHTSFVGMRQDGIHVFGKTQGFSTKLCSSL